MVRMLLKLLHVFKLLWNAVMEFVSRQWFQPYQCRQLRH